jgi:hypothetical protein
MAALSAIRDTEKLDSSLNTLHGFPQKAATKLWFGALAVLNAGYARSRDHATTGLVMRRALRARRSDNSSGANGDVVGQVEAGTFKWDNSVGGRRSSPRPTSASPCYIVDDHTVAKTSNGGGTQVGRRNHPWPSTAMASGSRRAWGSEQI